MISLCKHRELSARRYSAHYGASALAAGYGRDAGTVSYAHHERPIHTQQRRDAGMGPPRRDQLHRRAGPLSRHLHPAVLMPASGVVDEQEAANRIEPRAILIASIDRCRHPTRAPGSL